jgi:hypothetical protein
LLELYDNKTITLVQVLNQLGCGRSRFYELWGQVLQYNIFSDFLSSRLTVV